MKIYLIIALVFFLSILIYGISVVLHFSKKNSLSKEKVRFYKKIIKKTSIGNSNKEKIIEYDKIYHKVLNDLGYTGTFGDILKQYPNEINDIDKIWELHKLRNKLVHEFDLITGSILKKKAMDYKNELEKLIG